MIKMAAVTFNYWIYCLSFRFLLLFLLLLFVNRSLQQRQSLLNHQRYDPSARLTAKNSDVSYDDLNQQQVIQTVPKLNLASYGIEFKDRSKITNKIRFQTNEEDHEVDNRKEIIRPSPSPVAHGGESSDYLRRIQDSLRELDWEYFDRRRPVTSSTTRKPSTTPSTTSTTRSSFQIDDKKIATWTPPRENRPQDSFLESNFKSILDLVNRTFSTSVSGNRDRKLVTLAPKEMGGAKREPTSGGNPPTDHVSLPILVDCQQECVAKHYLQHYYANQCRPVFSRDCDCVKYFVCPKGSLHLIEDPPQPQPPSPSPLTSATATEVAEDNSSNYSNGSYCWLDGHAHHHPGKRYSIGQIVPVPNKPCSVCRCQRDHSVRGRVRAKIDCSLVIDCPELAFGAQPSRLDCYFAYSHDRCCGEEICPDRLKWDDYRLAKCRYRNQTYRFGEPILLKENRCKRCICNEHWNEFDPESSEESCQDEFCLNNNNNNNNNLQGGGRTSGIKDCLPVYRTDTCCPVDFICPATLGSTNSNRNLTASILEPREQNDYGVYGKYFTGNQMIQPDDQVVNATNFSRYYCKILGKQYRLGKIIHLSKEVMFAKSTCATCQCKIPPLMTCLANPQCEIGASNWVFKMA